MELPDQTSMNHLAAGKYLGCPDRREQAPGDRCFRTLYVGPRDRSPTNPSPSQLAASRDLSCWHPTIRPGVPRASPCDCPNAADLASTRSTYAHRVLSSADESAPNSLLFFGGEEQRPCLLAA